MLLPQLLEQVAACLQAAGDGVRVGLDHQQLGVVTRGAGGVVRLRHGHGLYHPGQALLLGVHSVQSVLDRAHRVHRGQGEGAGAEVREVGPRPQDAGGDFLIRMEEAAVPQSVNPDLSLPCTAGSHLDRTSRYVLNAMFCHLVCFTGGEVDGEGVLVLLTGTDHGPGHSLTGPTSAVPVLQQVILQHPGRGLQHKPAILPALTHEAAFRNNKGGM